MAKVYTLKRATPKMKYQHMNRVLEFRANLRNSQAQGMTEGTREFMLLEIKRMMGATEAYYQWFDKVYIHRSNNDMPTYEKKIRQKYYYLKGREKKRATPPSTDGMSAFQASETLSAWMKKNWQYIKEVPL